MGKEILIKIINEVARQKKEIQALKTKITKLEAIASKGKLKVTYEYFEPMNNEEVEYFLTKFQTSKDTIEKSASEALDCLRSKNKTYSNYRAFLSNWLRRKKIKELTEKEIQINRERKIKLEKMKKRLANNI